MEAGEKKLIEDMRDIMASISDMDDNAHYGVGYVNGEYRIYTVGTIKLFLREAREYYNAGMIRAAVDIVKFIKSLYRAGD